MLAFVLPVSTEYWNWEVDALEFVSPMSLRVGAVPVPFSKTCI